jgi:hypothetical protein
MREDSQTSDAIGVLNAWVLSIQHSLALPFLLIIILATQFLTSWQAAQQAEVDAASGVPAAKTLITSLPLPRKHMETGA